MILAYRMAWHEMRLLLSKLLYHFDLVVDDESRNWTEQNVYILWQKKPLMCRLSPRTEIGGRAYKGG